MSKKHTWILACALVVALGCLPALAQDKPDQSSQPSSQPQSSTQSAGQTSADAAANVDPATKAKVQARLQKIATDLNLTDDQKTKIKPLLQEEFQQLKTVSDDTSLSSDQRQAKMKEIHQTYGSQIQAVLTPEQQKKWAAMKEQKKQEMEQK